MRTIKHDLFERLLVRCEEIAVADGEDPSVALLYMDLLAAPAMRFRAAHKAIADAETAAGTANAEALQALEDFDHHFRAARALARAYIPALATPDTLKRQPTDTDKASAIQDLFDILASRAGETWAKTCVESAFGKLAPGVIEALRRADDCATKLAEARRARAEAYGPAYAQFLAFKRVVREAHGPRSRTYARIHLRCAAGMSMAEEAAPAAAAAPAPAAAAAPAPAAVPVPVSVPAQESLPSGGAWPDSRIVRAIFLAAATLLALSGCGNECDFHDRCNGARTRNSPASTMEWRRAASRAEAVVGSSGTLDVHREPVDAQRRAHGMPPSPIGAARGGAG
jgi:hypothetical protein